MTEVGKRIGWVATVFALTMAGCVAALVLTSLIPRQVLQEHMEQAASYVTTHDLFDTQIENRPFSTIDNYADTGLIDIIYCIDSAHPLTSVIRDDYYWTRLENVNESFARVVAVGGQSQETAIPKDLQSGVISYARYWHGSMVWLRPLFVLFSLEGVRMATETLGLGLVAAACAVLAYRKHPGPALAVPLALLSSHFWMGALCLEYSILLVPLGAVLLVLVLNDGRALAPGWEGDKFCLGLFVAAGVVTAFTDFLTAETLTFTLPLLVLVSLRQQRGSLGKVRELMAWVVQLGLAWLVGYAGCFLVKWALIALVMGPGALGEAVAAAGERMTGTVTQNNLFLAPQASKFEQVWGAVWRNLHSQFGFSTEMGSTSVVVSAALTLMLAVAIGYVWHERPVSVPELLVFCVVGVLPYMRFMVLSNHAYLHYYFAYRAQAATVAALILAVWGCCVRSENRAGSDKGHERVSRRAKK